MAVEDSQVGKNYNARKELFKKGLKEGKLTVEEIEEAIKGQLTAAERWLLYYSLRMAQVEIIGEEPKQ